MTTAAALVMHLIPDALAEGGIGRDRCRLDVGPLTPRGGLAWLAADDVLWIYQLDSLDPGVGVGRATMARLCMLADEHDCRLALNPWAQKRANAPGRTLDQFEMERFYQSLGFGWRCDHVMVREPHVPTVAHVLRDVAYLPAPNRVELVLDATPPPIALTRTSFVVGIGQDGSVLMAVNRRRGVEVPGGHVEDGETLDETALREGFEETGARFDGCRPIGHLRMTSRAPEPEGWRHPHPLSYQSFFAARISAIEPRRDDDECLAPKPVSDLSTLAPHVRLLAMRARTALGVVAN